MHNLSKSLKPIVVSPAVAAGVTTINTTAVDTQGFGGIAFIANFGTLTATQVTSVKAQQSDDDGATDAYSDIAGSSTGPLADGDSGKSLIIDIHKPRKRYVRLVVVRGTANAVINNVTALLFNPSHTPPAADASIVETTVLSEPAEGTA